MSGLLSPSLGNLLATHQQQKLKDPNHINVFELTLLLKVMGFRLNYLDYEEAATGENVTSSSEITVEIKCGNRNIVSRLSAPGDLCSCPAKREDHGHDSSFWEILGTAPSSSPGKSKIEDTSSNLLPELSKRGVSNTKHLLSLIYDGFHKDHLPSTPTVTSTSPEDRKHPPTPNFCTSTAVKSPMRVISVLKEDLLMDDSPMGLPVPPNTPRVGGLTMNCNIQSRDHIVYLEVVAAKERLEKALLCMKVNIGEEMDKYRVNEKSFQIFKESPLPTARTSPPAKLQRRSSLGSFVNIKSKVDTGAKPKMGLARNKSSVDTAAALKAKAAVNSRYLQPKTTTFAGRQVTTSIMNGRRVSPLARTGSTPKTAPVKRPANATWK